MGRFLIILGLVIAGLGLLVSLGLPLGRLPGDLSWKRGNVSVHVPLATSIVLSIVLTLLFALFRR